MRFFNFKKIFITLICCVSIYYSGLQAILYIYRGLDSSKNLSDPRILKEIAIVSTSFDKRSEIWPLQFEMLFKKWPRLKQDLQYIPVYLVSNFRIYNDPRVQTIAVGEDIAWSDNLIQALKKIEKKYVIIFMDDYILTEKVDENRLIEIANLMKQNHSPHTELYIDKYYRYDGIVHKSVHGLMYKDQMGRGKTVLQPGIWDREDLLALLKPGESAWAFESKANKRSWLYFRPFYITICDPVFKIANLMTVVMINGTARESDYNPLVVQNLIKEGIITKAPEALRTQSTYVNQ